MWDKKFYEKEIIKPGQKGVLSELCGIKSSLTKKVKMAIFDSVLFELCGIKRCLVFYLMHHRKKGVLSELCGIKSSDFEYGLASDGGFYLNYVG